jgi:hypothetical protein
LLVLARCWAGGIEAVTLGQLGERALKLLDGFGRKIAILRSKIWPEAGQLARHGVVGQGVDVCEAQTENLGDATELVWARGGKGALLDTNDGPVINGGLLLDVSDGESELFAALAQPTTEFLGLLWLHPVGAPFSYNHCLIDAA